jgi:hypothetical protein
VALALRLSSRELCDLDSVNFALGIGHFDPRVHQPHPLVMSSTSGAADCLNHFTADPNLALVLLSIAASCGTIVFIYMLALSGLVDWRHGSRRFSFFSLLLPDFTASLR